MLELKNIYKYYPSPNDGEIKVLEDYSLKVNAGEFVAVQGTSGCGKSTLLMLAGGLLSPDKGEVFIDEKNIYAMGQNERAVFRATNLGFVFQQFHLLPYLNVLENVMSGALCVPAFSGADGKKQKAKELLDLFGISDRALHYPSELSVGERQRVAMARAVIHEPKILLADEPTGNLDAENSKVILDFFNHFSDNGGIVLMVTHGEDAAMTAGRRVNL